MQEIFRTKYNDKELILLEENDNFIYESLKDEKITYDLEEDKEILNKILIELMPSHNLSDLGYIKYNKKNFKHFYDIKKDFHLFYEGDNFKIPNDDDLENLNYIFNNQEEYVAIYRKETPYEKQRKKIKRIIKIGSLSLVVIVSLTGLKLTLNNLLKEEPLRLTTKEQVKSLEINDNYKYKNSNNIDEINSDIKEVTQNDIISAIAINNNLTPEEKNLFLSSNEFITDITPYLSQDVIYKLRDFKIEYTKDIGINNRAAEWQEVLLTMKIYNTENLTLEVLPNLSHEFIHIFSNIKSITLGNALYEFLTVNMNNEYFGNNSTYDKSYNWLLKYGMPLVDLIGKDVLQKYYVNPSPDILTNALMEIIPDFNMAYRTLNNFDTFNNLWRSHYDADFQEKWGSTMQQVILELEQDLMSYYNAKYRDNNEENLSCLYYLDKTEAISIIAENLGLDEKAKENLRIYPDIVSVKDINRNFNEKDYSQMVLIFPTVVDVQNNYYTKEQLLNGVDGLKYTNIFEIDLPLMENGMYKYTDIKANYIEYKVPGIYKINAVNRINSFVNQN